MTLLEIFETKEIYPSDELNNYFHNLQVIKEKEITPIMRREIRAQVVKIKEVEHIKIKNIGFLDKYTCLQIYPK